MGTNLVFAQHSAWLADHHAMHRLAPLLAGDANHRTHQYRRMAGNHVLDLCRVHVLAAADDHVLEAVDDVDVALLVHVSAVTGEQPAPAQGLGGFFGLVPVALHDVRAAHDDFAHGATGYFTALCVDDLDVHAIATAPHRTRQATVPRFKAVVFRRVGGNDRAGFGQAVAVYQFKLGQLGQHVLDHLASGG
ncbi:hypothetical protein D3C80_551090 [compost metagenome]